MIKINLYGYKNDYAHEHPQDFVTRKRAKNTIFWRDQQGYRVRKVTPIQYKLFEFLEQFINKKQLLSHGISTPLLNKIASIRTIKSLIKDEILVVKSDRIYLHDRGPFTKYADPFITNGLRNKGKVIKK